MRRDESLRRTAAVRRLFNLVFERDTAEEYFRWRYSPEPLGEVEVTLLERDGEVLFHYGSSVVEFNLGTETVRGAFAFAAMTHPSLRGQGVMQRLYREHEAKVRANGCDFIFGFPNASADPIYFRHLGWIPLADIPTRYLDLVNLDLDAVSEFEFDDIFNKFDYDANAQRAGLFACRRTAAFLRWRYSANPVNRYRNLLVKRDGTPVGHVVVKMYRPVEEVFLDVVDWHAPEERDTNLVIQCVIDYAHSIGCRGINIWAPRHHYVHLTLSRLGFVTGAPVTYFSYKPFTSRLPERLNSWPQWWITMGDSDVY